MTHGNHHDPFFKFLDANPHVLGGCHPPVLAVCRVRVPTMSSIARRTFEIEMTPGPPEVDGDVARFDFTKTFSGDLVASGAGVMLSCGDPQAGEAGYVALEMVRGRLSDQDGGFALQQLGKMHDTAQTLTYEVVPGSGRGALESIVGTFVFTVEKDGTHRYQLDYDL